MRTFRAGGISLLIVGMLVPGVPALAESAAKTPAPAASGSAAPPATATPAPSASGAPAPSAAAPQAAPPDLVELKDGGMYRGTISEKVPGDHVVIVTVTGATKTFAMKDVKYAGPAAQRPDAQPVAPPGAPPAKPEPKSAGAESTKPIITLHAGEARLLIKGDQPGLTVYRKSGTAVAVGPGGSAIASGYNVICTAPCDASLPAGTQTLAVSRQDGSPVEAGAIKVPEGESRLTAHYKKKTGLRVAGWVVLGGGVAAGTVVMALGLTNTTHDCSSQWLTGECTVTLTSDTGEIVAGGILMAAGIGVGLALALQHDKASITVTPMEAAPLRHTSWSNPALDRLSPSGAGAPGLGLTARF